MKKILFFLAAGALVFASCSKEDGARQGSAGDEMYVSFKVKAPAPGVVTYANVAAVADESRVYELRAYVFGPNPNAASEVLGTTDEYVFESEQVFRDIPNDALTYTVSGLKVTGRTMKHIYFVANRVVNAVKGSTTETSFINSGVGAVAVAENSKQPYISLSGWGVNSSGLLVTSGWDVEMFKPGLPMSAYTEVDFTTGVAVADPSAYNVALLRAVARIDVANVTTNYRIHSVTVKSRSNGYNFPSEFSTTDGSYEGLLYPGMDALDVPVTSVRVDGYAGSMMTYGAFPCLLEPVASGTPDRTTNFTEVLGAGYLYEASAADAASVVIKCINTVNGVIRAIEIPFEQNDLAIAVQRNYVYRFFVTETVTRDLEAAFEVVDWVDAGVKLEIDETVSVAVQFNVTGVTNPDGTTFSGTTLNAPAEGGSFAVNVSAYGLPIVAAFPSEIPAWVKNWTIADLGNGQYQVQFDLDAATNPFTYTAQINLMADLGIEGFYPTSTFVINRAGAGI